MSHYYLTGLLFLLTGTTIGQNAISPVNGVHDQRLVHYLIKNATIIKSSGDTISAGMILIKDKLIVEIGTNVSIPEGSVILDIHGRFIYPSFIDPYSSYGLPANKKPKSNGNPQFESNVKGAYSWNQALHPEMNAYEHFEYSSDFSKKYREAGFGAAISLVQDGISRGTAMAVSFGPGTANQLIIKNRIANCYSFNKGSSTQNYPGSQMGAIALIRQTYYDAEWYNKTDPKPFLDISLESWNNNSDLISYFEAKNKYEILRAQNIGDEFDVKYIFKGSGDEYQRAIDIQKLGSPIVIPVNFPEGFDLNDPYDALNVTIGKLKHWEMAPHNARILDSLNITFAFTSDGLKELSKFPAQLRKISKTGLHPLSILQACTSTPAKLFALDDQIGDIDNGKRANFIIVSKDLFDDNTFIMENWCDGKRLIFDDATRAEISGSYLLSINENVSYDLTIKNSFKGKYKASLKAKDTTTSVQISRTGNQVTLTFTDDKNHINYRLAGTFSNATNSALSGNGLDNSGQWFKWHATRKDILAKLDSISEKKGNTDIGSITYPNKAYGLKELPKAESVIITNTTIWTNESEGILKGIDVIIKNGKIFQIGKELDRSGLKVIDGTDKHLTSGIIDEHSHIAIYGGVNECTQAVTAEVRIGDVINSDDINIYRQLAGGVTAAQLLHGSCNPIGGQSALIKLRWGSSPDQMKIAGAPGFIKFALGENVKQSNWGDKHKTRYPQTRMGVEQVYYDAFIRAKNYSRIRSNEKLREKEPVLSRKNLELDALNEIMNEKRFISCHSYQQGEINMLMHVGDSMGFRVNTFTHILEGYKVADKMKAHGVGASTFSDWWAYKYEVIEAIPFNGAIMHKAGIVTAFNSDDAEMGRRLNQEAAKAIKYGGLSEEDAWKFVTLNPAKLLHLDNRMGSVKVGKDADLVLWNTNPLSIYAYPDYTYVDGACYYSKEIDQKLSKQNELEKIRLVNKMRVETKDIPNGELKKPSHEEQESKHCINEEDLNP